MSRLENFFNPQSIAIVGASEEAGKVGTVITKNITSLGYSGKVYLVNPNHEEIFSMKCYKSLQDIDGPVDLAIIAIPAKFVNSAIKESAKLVKNFAVISAGFAEISVEGKEREDELSRIANEYELNILGPNCLGFIAPYIKLNASFAGGLPEAGNISFVSQSGALAVAIMDIAKNKEIKFSNVISIGNKMQIDETGLLEYLDTDQNTKIIGMYLEGIKDGQKFMEMAKRVSRHKPVVVLKAGKSEKAQKAISSHTGALAGSDMIINAVFEKAGVLRADNFEDFFSLVNLISRTEAPPNSKVAVITNAGGPGVLTADAFDGKEINLADLSSETKKKLADFLPEESAIENPVDLLGDAMEDRYEKVLDIISEEKEIGTIVCVLTPQDQTPVEKISQVIINFKKKKKKNILAIFIGGEKIKQAVSEMEKNGIPNFSFPDQAISSLNKYYQWSQARSRSFEKEIKHDEERRKKALEIIQIAKTSNQKALLFSEAKTILKLYGIRVIASKNAKEKDSVEISYPAVVKVDSDTVLHKTDRKGVILNIRNNEELLKAVEEIGKNFPEENIIVQPMLERQTELILGIKNDPTVGPVIVYGLGGIYTEIFKLVNFLIPPLSITEIGEALLKSKLSFIFKETRGQKPYDHDALTEILANLSLLAEELVEIKELDINPLLVYNDGRESVVIDIKIII